MTEYAHLMDGEDRSDPEACLDECLRRVAREDALAIGAEMAQEITDIADSLEESSGDCADVLYLRRLVWRWEAVYRVLDRQGVRDEA